MGTDALVIGSGPAALAIASELCHQGLAVQGLAAADPQRPWANTYGIWGTELDRQGLEHLLAHRWSRCVGYFGEEPLPLGHDYGLIDKDRLQQHWLGRCERGAMVWHQGLAGSIEHARESSTVTTRSGSAHTARLVIDASGHEPVFVRRPDRGPVAGQAAYGIVGTFSSPPVESGQFVLMDWRSDHLDAEERHGPPTFLYAMDLGGGRHFVEETSLALAPPMPFDRLRERLHRRLAHHGVRVEQAEHEELCLFPMNLPLPDLRQHVLGFGGAASMVHPASGYMVGSLLRRAPGLAETIARSLDTPALPSLTVAEEAWQALWPKELVRKHAIYQFGLEKLMRFSEAELRHFFAAFFALPLPLWYGFLANTLSLPELIQAMVRLFAIAPNDVRWGLMNQQGREPALFWRALTG
jgi:lycopene beta-cyclase